MKLYIDTKELWSVEVNKEDVIGSIEHKIFSFMNKYYLRANDIKAVALGPNEFNALRFQIEERITYGKSLASSSEGLNLFGKKIYCCGIIGIHLLVDEAWYPMIEEARGRLSGEGLDS